MRKRYSVSLTEKHIEKAEKIAKELGHTKPSGEINLSQLIRFLIDKIHDKDLSLD